MRNGYKKLKNLWLDKRITLATRDITIQRPKCSKCGKQMKLRKGRYGDFLGCSNYPKCTNTKDINPNRPIAVRKLEHLDTLAN